MVSCNLRNDSLGRGSCLYSSNSEINLFNCIIQHGKRTGITLSSSIMCGFHVKVNYLFIIYYLFF